MGASCCSKHFDSELSEHPSESRISQPPHPPEPGKPVSFSTAKLEALERASRLHIRTLEVMPPSAIATARPSPTQSPQENSVFSFIHRCKPHR